MWRCVLVAVLLASGCEGDVPERVAPRGTFRGLGENTLVLRDPAWSLRSGTVLWSGTYRIEGDRLILRTDAVEPLATHGTDRLAGEEVNRWSWEGADRVLAFEGTPWQPEQVVGSDRCSLEPFGLNAAGLDTMPYTGVRDQ